MKDKIINHLTDAYPWKDSLICFPSIGSTNDHLRALAKAGAPAGTAVIADHQTGGHGRRGRSFHSPEGVGVYLSLLLRPDCPPSQLMHLTCAVAVAGQRKLGGILTEIGFNAAGNVDWAIIGVGINCRQQISDFPEEIRDMAGSLSVVTGRDIDRDAVAAAMLEQLHLMSEKLLTRQGEILDQYRRDCMTLNRDVVLVRGDEKRYGRAVDIDSEGALVVRFADGREEAVNSGEVSVRGMYGYV